MRQEPRSNGSIRSSALWGKPKGEIRSSALWGKGGRGLVSLLVVAMVMVAPMAATAGSGSSGKPSQAKSIKAYLSPGLERAAERRPNATFAVIVQGTLGNSTKGVASAVAQARSAAPGNAAGLKKRFATISGVSAQVTGRQILRLASRSGILSITTDGKVLLSGYSNKQQWPHVAEVAKYWDAASNAGLKAPTIAIVDSGIESGRADFGGRVIKAVTMTQLAPNSPGDGRGHGTFVAGIAAGSADGYAGAAPNANIVSIDVIDDKGMAMTSDVIAAADWIYQNKDAYGIRVANFSLHSAAANSFMFDPLDKAVEKLWFSGVVVVAAAGNYGTAGQPSGVPFAPGNDPFIITVGAADTSGTMGASDDLAAPWSAYGSTLDGFMKPELGAPGRYIVGPVPATSTLPLERPANVTAPGYMQLSGTSFAAPVVAGAAAYVLAVHPSWTPDQVKGALMLTASPSPVAAPNSIGVGEVKASKAANLLENPPNPNLALNQFVVSQSGGSGKVFDAASWASAAFAGASWASASWASASWASASWSSASWASASWSSASWASASWASAAFVDASWASASWASASWASASYEDGAEGEQPLAEGGYWVEDDSALLSP